VAPPGRRHPEQASAIPFVNRKDDFRQNHPDIHIMKLSGNTLLITGGGSGIGRALAEAFHARGNKVIIAGRRKASLEAVTAANPGMLARTLDVESPEAIRRFAGELTAEHPDLNVLINNAGIMRPENLLADPVDSSTAEATIATNLLGPMRLTAALLPHLRRQARAAVLNVSSGLAFLPRSSTPTYGATKAALHSYTQSLRYQLRATSVQVIEVVPPYVQTELTGSEQARDPNAMPLQAYITETMQLLETAPDAVEILVERVKPLRFSEANGNHDTLFKQYNDRLPPLVAH
jgi:uncharacterized oxidoreductase